MEQNKQNSQEKKKRKKARTVRIRRLSYLVGSLFFVFTLTVLFGLSFDFPDRPSFSESEKRELASFPKLTASALFSGDYFDDINLWFSDTFPFRDSLVKTSTGIKKMLGIGQSIHHFSENTGDAIPDAEGTSQDYVDITAGQPEQNSVPDLYKPALPAGNPQNSQQSGGEKDNAVEQNLGAIYIYDDSAYEYYNFVQSTADKYVGAVNAAAASLKGSGVNVYNMIIPTSMDITLNDKTRSKLNSSDQKNAINYMYSKTDGSVKTVALYDLLRAHRDEYIYFRTDHHWTTLGAYYAYAQFMTVKGTQFEQLNKFTEYRFDGFRGSFYTDTGKNQNLASSPDTVYAYMPSGNISFRMKEKGAADFIDWPLICDASDYSESYKYLCFIGGDNPISVIENKDMQNGETCVLVKESFGNAFAPYLACNYQYVYIIDYRYYDGDITDFAKEKGATDLILQNNISMTRNQSLVDKLSETL